MQRRLVGWLAAAGTCVAAIHCGANSGASSGSFSGTGANASPIRHRWDPGGGSEQGTGGAGAAKAPATASGVGGASATPGALCPSFSTDPKIVTLAVPRARATVSPAQARGVLRGTAATAPDPTSIRAGDFLNYYRVTYDKGTPLGIAAGMALGVVDSELVLQVGVQAPDAAMPRRRSVITAVVDTSISMTGDGIARARAAVTAMVAALRPGDQLNLVTSNPGVPPRSFTLSGPDDAAALKLVSALAADGGEDVGGALVKAYGLANQKATAGALNRVVLITDGGVPASTIDLGLIDTNATGSGIRLIGVGVGPAIGYDDALLANASAAGRGSNVYLDRPEEAEAILHQRFDEVMDVVAGAVELTVTLPWYLTVEAPAGAQGVTPSTGGLVTADLGPGRSMIFRETLRACNAKAIAHGDLVTIDVSYTPAGGGDRVHVPFAAVSVGDLLHQTQPQINKVSAILAYADALRSHDVLRVNEATKLAGDVAFDGDPDFADPSTGIRALIALENKFLK